MKTYYLRFVTSDFVKDGNVWTTGVVDLYDNYSAESQMATPSYRNYSTVKSNYGLDSLGNRTFVGIEPGDTGTIEDGRFIDESGRIDIIDYEYTLSGINGQAPTYATLETYTIDDPTSLFTSEWALTTSAESNSYIGVLDSYRYVRFILRLRSEQVVSAADIEFIVQVRIGEPLQGGSSYKQVRQIQRELPEWMAVRELDREDPATPTLATPVTVGAQLLNAVAGEWLDDISDDIAYTSGQQFIATADLNQKAWVYIYSGAPTKIHAITGDNVELARCVTLDDFYKLTPEEDAFWLDEGNSTIFSNKNYDTFQVNYQTYELNAQHLWNWFDEFGLRVDLRRHHLESNQYFRARILNTFVDKPGVGIEAFKLALRRELSLWQYYGATPSTIFGPESESASSTPGYFGATPEVYEISDLETHSDFVTVEGLPTEKFRRLVATLAAEYPSTWGNFVWNQATWDAGGPQGEGYTALARQYDSEPLPDEDTQSGIGDGNDLYIYRPDEITGPREFIGRAKVKGRRKLTRSESREIRFDVDVWAEAPRLTYANAPVTNHFHVRIQKMDYALATPSLQYFYHTFTITSQSDVDQNQATPSYNSYGEYSFLDADGRAVDGTVWFQADGDSYTVGQNGFEFTRGEITGLTLNKGRAYYSAGVAVDNLPVVDNYVTWYTGGNKAVNYLSTSTGSSLAGILPANGTISMESKVTSNAPSTWVSEKQRFSIKMNGALPDQTVQNYTLPKPTIALAPNLTGPVEYWMELVTHQGNSSSPVGGFTTDNTGASRFLSSSLIYVNGSNTWTSNKKQFTVIPSTFVFSSGTSADYPVTGCPYWDLFEANSTTTFQGVVDENGPWRFGVAPLEGNTNFNLTSLSLYRSDFGIPDSTDYVITWIGVEPINTSRVITWLDSNSVLPYYSDGTSFTYPDNAVVESLSGAELVLGPFIVRARLNPGFSEQWNPQMHSGWFYDRNDEYYAFASPEQQLATVTSTGATLSYVARQGAPIIVNPATPYDSATPYRQVAFWDDTNKTYTMTNTEEMPGTGINALFAAYDDIHTITVMDLTTNTSVGVVAVSGTNKITTNTVTNKDHTYQVQYKVRRSFFADHDAVLTNSTPHTQNTILHFDAPLTTPHYVEYERNKFDPATPIDLPLNTFYTIMDEGFIFLSNNEYDLAKVEVRMSPSSVIADGEDYMLITLRSLDEHGNPKPNAQFTLGTTYGTLENTNVITNDDGFAVLKLTSEVSAVDLEGVVTISGDVSATVGYQVSPAEPKAYRLTAVPSVQQIPADNESSLYVVGKVENESYEPVPGAVVFWRKGRYMQEIWEREYSINQATPGHFGDSGRVIADTRGVFTVGPFIAATPSSPGYWMVVLESERSSPTYFSNATPSPTSTPEYDLVGDAVFWVEFPDTQYGVENLNGLPKQTVQSYDRTEEIPDIAPIGRYKWPTLYDEATTNAPATPVQDELNYEPSKWFALPRYRQYQLGLLGDQRKPEQATDLSEAHPDYRKF